MSTFISVRANDHNRWVKPLFGILIAGLAVGITACSTTRQVTRGVEPSGFLVDSSQLQRGTKGHADWIYINPNADWAKYNKVFIESVQLWAGDDKDSWLKHLSPEKQQMLADFFHTAISHQLSGSYEIVDQPGPDVIVVRSAITEGKASRPLANFITSVYPAGRVLSLAKQLITDTGIGVGSVQIEGELLDGATKQRLAAAVDARAGTKALRSKFSGTWGDAKLCFDWWALRLAVFLTDARTGRLAAFEL